MHIIIVALDMAAHTLLQLQIVMFFLRNAFCCTAYWLWIRL